MRVSRLGMMSETGSSPETRLADGLFYDFFISSDLRLIV